MISTLVDMPNVSNRDQLICTDREVTLSSSQAIVVAETCEHCDSFMLLATREAIGSVA